MSITLELPKEVEYRLRKSAANLEREAQEAVALDLFRREKISHFELGQVLGLDRWATDAFLKSRGEFAQTLTLAEVEQDRTTIRQLLRDANS